MPRILTPCLPMAVGGAFLASLTLHAADLNEVLPVTNEILQLSFDEGHVDYEGFGQGFDGGANLNGEYEPLDLDLAEDPAYYEISSPDDPAYALAQSPINVGRKSRGSDFLDVYSSVQFIQWHQIYLELPSPLIVGKTYTIHLYPALASNVDDYTFVFNPDKLRSETVHTNQIGYQPDAKKYGYLSHWMGSFTSAEHPSGGLTLANYVGQPFRLVRQSDGATVFTGTVALRKLKTTRDNEQTSHYGPNGNYTYANVYDCDFTAFTTPGTYRLVVDNLGSGYPFEIKADAYREAFHTTLRGLFHQRAGIEKQVEPGWILERDQHPDNTSPAKPFYYDPAKTSNFEDNGPDIDGNFSLTRRVDNPSGPDDDGPWGWYHDAGDWDGYTTHFRVPLSLLYAYHLKKLNGDEGAFYDGDVHNLYKLNPASPTWSDEGANGHPDILDEASWLIKWGYRARYTIERLGYGNGAVRPVGHPNAGKKAAGVPAYIGRDAGWFPNPSWDDPRYILVAAEARDATLLYSASAAWYAYLIGPAHPDYTLWRNEAIDAYNRWSIQPSESRATAAAALYLLTQDVAYQTTFKNYFSISAEPGWSGLSYRDFGMFIYATLPDSFPGLDIAKRNSIRNDIISRVNFYQIDYAAANRGYRSPSSSRSQGSFQTVFSTPRTMWIATAYEITGDQKYLDGIRYAADYVLGGNELNMVLMTGMGDKRENATFHIDSWYSQDYNSSVYTNPIAPGLAPYGIVEPTGDWFSTGSGNSGNGFNFWGDEDWSRSSAYPAIPRWNAAIGMTWPPAEARFQNRRSIPGSEFTVHQNNNEWAFTMAYLLVDSDQPFSNQRPTVSLNLTENQKLAINKPVTLTATTSADTAKVAYYYYWHLIGESTDKANNFALTWDPSQTDLINGDTQLMTAVAYDELGLRSNPSDAGDKTAMFVTVPDLVSVVSRRVHGAAGTFDIPLPATGPSGIECRNGTTATLVFTLSSPVASASAAVTAGTASVGSTTISGSTVTVTLTGVANAQTVSVALTIPGYVYNATFRMLIGDATADARVNAADALSVKTDSGKPVDASRFRKDLNADGSLNAADASLAKSRSGTSIP